MLDDQENMIHQQDIEGMKVYQLGLTSKACYTGKVIVLVGKDGLVI